MTKIEEAGPVERRTLVKGASLATFGALLGTVIPFGRNLPDGLIPVALAQTPPDEITLLEQKDGLVVLGDKPLNAETPPHLLDDDITPVGRLFVRNHGLTPFELAGQDPATWEITIDGEVERPLTLTLGQLQSEFEVVTYQAVLECAGNGRAFFQPGASGNPWTFGAVGNVEWTGVRLKDVLARAGVKAGAVYTGHYGADHHLSGDPAKDALSRGVPIEKAVHEASLIAWAMNGEPLPMANGWPVRLVFPGWIGSVSQKWLTRVWIRNQTHDGERMGGMSYRVPVSPVAPGTEVPADAPTRIITNLLIKSLITAPATGAEARSGEAFEVRGHAWAGDNTEVAAVDVSIDFGQTWASATLDPPVSPHAWRRWRADVTLPTAGYYEVWARATDSNGNAQPAVVPGWNPAGYGNNMMHRIALVAS